LFRRARGLLVVAASAGRDHVRPHILSALAEGPDVLARELPRREALPAVHAEEGVAPEERLVVEGWNVIVARVTRIAGVTVRGHDRVHLQHRPTASACVGAAVEPVEPRAAGVGHLLL